MQGQCVVAVYNSRNDAEQAYCAVVGSGVPSRPAGSTSFVKTRTARARAPGSLLTDTLSSYGGATRR